MRSATLLLSIVATVSTGLIVACGGAESGVATVPEMRPEASPSSTAPPVTTLAASTTSPATTVASTPPATTSSTTSSTAPATTSSTAPTTAPSTAPSTTPPPAGPFVVHWIGGSDVVLEDRDLPAAVERRLAPVGGRTVHLVADTLIGPLVPDITARVEAADAAGADGLIVALNVSWVHWDGAACKGLRPAEVRYACLMTPISPTVTAANAAAITELVDAVVATGLPAYLYTIPHSSDSLADDRLREPIAAAEAALLAFDPGLPTVELVGIFNRGLDGMAVGDGFINVVHPTVAGVARLADWLAVDLLRFWTGRLA